jgi:hypothetical protein
MIWFTIAWLYSDSRDPPGQRPNSQGKNLAGVAQRHVMSSGRAVEIGGGSFSKDGSLGEGGSTPQPSTISCIRLINGADGISDIEGKATRVGASERGQQTSFKTIFATIASR